MSGGGLTEQSWRNSYDPAAVRGVHVLSMYAAPLAAPRLSVRLALATLAVQADRPGNSRRYANPAALDGGARSLCRDILRGSHITEQNAQIAGDDDAANSVLFHAALEASRHVEAAGGAANNYVTLPPGVFDRYPVGDACDRIRRALGNPFRPIVYRCTSCTGEGCESHCCETCDPAGIDHCRHGTRCKPRGYRLGVDPRLLTADVRNIVPAVIDGDTPPGVLADALEDAGCGEERLLMPLRCFDPVFRKDCVCCRLSPPRPVDELVEEPSPSADEAVVAVRQRLLEASRAFLACPCEGRTRWTPGLRFAVGQLACDAFVTVLEAIALQDSPERRGVWRRASVGEASRRRKSRMRENDDDAEEWRRASAYTEAMEAERVRHEAIRQEILAGGGEVDDDDYYD